MSLSAHLSVNALLRCWGLGVLMAVLATGSQAQLQTRPLDNLNSLNASINIPTCLPAGLSNDNSNLLVVNLPAIDSSALREQLFGPVTPVVIDMANEAASACLKPLRQNASLVFDQALAALAPDSGLLRNTAQQNPATNVYVQLGFFDEQGLFTPLDLRQTFKLTPAMWRNSSNSLMLGARYVAARAVYRQNPNQLTTGTNSLAVTPGQVQVQLPFLMKVH
jgi:type 1 fimbria pilin